MKVFDGKKAAQEYMSAHTLAFSTPELTLTRFAFWLGDSVPDPEDRKKTTPRLTTYITEEDYEPVRIVDDDKYQPSGAVLGMYGNPNTEEGSDVKFCPECGAKMAGTAKFCPDCGTTQ